MEAAAPIGFDPLIRRDYLRSPSFVQQVDQALQFRAHYADTAFDPISRLSSTDVSIEQLHWYCVCRVSIEFDDDDGVLFVGAQAYNPAIAQAFTRLLLSNGEAFMNGNANQFAQSQVDFLQQHTRVMAAQQQLLAY